MYALSICGPLPPGFPTFATCGPLTDFDVTLHGNPRQAVLCKYNESTACREDALWPRNKGLLGATRLSMDLPTLAARLTCDRLFEACPPNQ